MMIMIISGDVSSGDVSGDDKFQIMIKGYTIWIILDQVRNFGAASRQIISLQLKYNLMFVVHLGTFRSVASSKETRFISSPLQSCKSAHALRLGKIEIT